MKVFFLCLLWCLPLSEPDLYSRVEALEALAITDYQRELLTDARDYLDRGDEEGAREALAMLEKEVES